ncbi:MAG: hypothetical protein ACRDO4_05175 [Nocardioides sp.]
MRRVLVPTLVAWALAGCGAAQGVDPSPHPEVTAADAAVRLVADAEADLILYVSNQSFEDEVVDVTVTIDDVTVVDGDFHVEDQHNWVSFSLALPAGGHEITAESDSGATLRESFEGPQGKKRYAVIDHWTEGAAELSWEFYRQPMGFG